MRMSAKAEYAVRAMVQLATAPSGTLVKTDDLAQAQGIPPQFLVDILTNLRTDRLVRSHRGREGGYELARPATEISIADVLRCIDGPLASVRDIGLGDLPYSGPTTALTDVWRALRASMRSVLEETTLADVAAGALPKHVAQLADDYRDQESVRHGSPRGGTDLAARAVGPSEDLHAMPGGIREVHPAAAVAVVDLAGPFGARVRPVRQAARFDLAVDRVELLLGDQECVVLPPDLLAFGDVGIVETGAVVECDNHEVAEWLRARQVEELGEKLRGFLFVACRDDGVVETDGHSSFLVLARACVFVRRHAVNAVILRTLAQRQITSVP